MTPANPPQTAPLRARRLLPLAAALAALLALSGCTVLTVAGAAAGAAISVTGAVVSTTVEVTGAVVKGAVGAATGSDDEEEDD